MTPLEGVSVIVALVILGPWAGQELITPETYVSVKLHNYVVRICIKVSRTKCSSADH